MFIFSHSELRLLNYEKQILTTKPSLFEADVMDNDSKKLIRLKSMVPVWNHRTGMYELDLFGTAKITSSKNLILVDSDSEVLQKVVAKGGGGWFDWFGEKKEGVENVNEKTKGDIYFVQGKRTKKEFNLHYRSPLSDFHAFAISLASMYKKTFA
jgi:hypothetical protein